MVPAGVPSRAGALLTITAYVRSQLDSLLQGIPLRSESATRDFQAAVTDLVATLPSADAISDAVAEAGRAADAAADAAAADPAAAGSGAGSGAGGCLTSQYWSRLF
jgi:hypothetical protein